MNTFEIERQIERIRKLLDLSVHNSSPAERALAAERAAELMRKYGLRMSDVFPSAQPPRPAPPPRPEPPPPPPRPAPPPPPRWTPPSRTRPSAPLTREWQDWMDFGFVCAMLALLSLAAAIGSVVSPPGLTMIAVLFVLACFQVLLTTDKAALRFWNNHRRASIAILVFLGGFVWGSFTKIPDFSASSVKPEHAVPAQLGPNEVWTYYTPSGHPCTEGDRDRQLLHGLKPGEERCLSEGVPRSITKQDPISTPVPEPAPKLVPTYTIEPIKPVQTYAIDPIRLLNGVNITPPLDSPGGLGRLKISNHTESDTIVKLKTLPEKNTVRFVYVRADSEVTLARIAPQTYHLQFATGRDWDATHLRFRENLICSAFDKMLSFTEEKTEDGTTYSIQEVTLHAVPNGNVLKVAISEREFLSDGPSVQ